MRVTGKQYAEVLFELTRDKSQEDISVVVSDFAKMLERDNKLKLKNEIIQKFTEIYNKENGILEAEIVSFEELNADMLDGIRNYISKRYEVKEVVINNRVDKKIRGGIIIKVGDEVMDASVDRQLIELKRKLAN